MENPYPGQRLRKVDFNAGGYGDSPEPVSDMELANLATSEVAGSLTTHKPLLDIDFPVKLIPSTTEGHFHLYLDKEVQWQDYELLLRALAVCGIIESGYMSASIERGYTAVRLPWIKKAGRSEEKADDLQGSRSLGDFAAGLRLQQGHTDSGE